MAQAAPAISALALAAYDKLIAGEPRVARKGAKIPYTSVNGNMSSFLARDGTLALRLPETAREAFLKKYKTKLSVQYSTVMKEYVVVSPSLLERTAELKPYFALSVAYVGGLKPKATTRRKPAARKAAKKPTRKTAARKSR